MFPAAEHAGLTCSVRDYRGETMKFTARTRGPDAGMRPAISGRLAGAALTAFALTAASLLAAASPAGATSPGRAAPRPATMALSAAARQAVAARRPFTPPTGLELGATPAGGDGT